MAAKRTCIVTPDLAGPTRNGGIGTHCLYLARLMARRGMAVTVVHTAHAESGEAETWKRLYREAHGVDLVMLDELPEADGVSILPLTPRHTIAHRVDRWLRAQVPAFDEVHFQDWQGNGAIAVRAKRCGAAHAATRLVVTVHGPSEWIREGMQEFPADGREGLIDDALERSAIAGADLLVCPSRAIRAWLITQGWPVPADTRVLPILFEVPGTPVVPRAVALGALEDLIFFGRLETRKGLEVFLAALEILATRSDPVETQAKSVRVHFVGKPHTTRLGPAEAAIEQARSVCGGRFSFAIQPSLDHTGALAFLREHPHALAVMPRRERIPQ